MIKGLPEKLKSLRKQYGLSQREAASRLGISTSVISAYENGERTPSTESLLGKESEPPKIILNTDKLSQKQLQILSDLIDTMS